MIFGIIISPCSRVMGKSPRQWLPAWMLRSLSPAATGVGLWHHSTYFREWAVNSGIRHVTLQSGNHPFHCCHLLAVHSGTNGHYSHQAASPITAVILRLHVQRMQLKKTACHFHYLHYCFFNKALYETLHGEDAEGNDC